VRELAESVAGTPLEARFARFAEPFAARRGRDASLARLAPRVRLGLARLLAANADAARWLSHRPTLLERLAEAGPATFDRRTAELDSGAAAEAGSDLETFLDDLRIGRRDDECLAACLDLGGLVPFEETSRFLSRLAEATTRRALAAAARDLPPFPLAVIGMGKIAGRELTYHSDLDLVFLSAEDPATAVQAPRLAQRLISYLQTMTVAGIAYAIDSRLRPSGRQGALVTTFEAFERYQREAAATWEHLALMRARAIAGDVERAAPALARIRSGVSGRGGEVWKDVADMRARVERERGAGSAGRIALKTGAGGLMDVEFLATGALLECGASPQALALPAIPAMLRLCAPGPGGAALAESYGLLRKVEARARFVAGRAVEEVPSEGESAAVVAELVEPGLAASELAERLAQTRGAVRAAYTRVVAGRTIGALDAGLVAGPARG
jgi:glutamate-ammonia-ligase adenylyltransferase